MADFESCMSSEDAFAIAVKVEEMAVRARAFDAVVPGAVASWAFEMDGVRYMLKLAVDRSPGQEPPR